METVSAFRPCAQEALWQEFDRMTRTALKTLMETFLEEERDLFLGRAAHVRDPERRGLRNGYFARTLASRHGLLRLRVPRVRAAAVPFRPLAFDAYRRRTRAVDAAIEHWIASGLSTRGVEAALLQAFGFAFSAATVSRVVARVEAELAAWQARPLPRSYRILYLDAKHGRIRPGRGFHGRRRAEKGVLLAAWGLRHDGREELVDVMASAGGESEESWTRFLTRLEARGVRRRNAFDQPLELIVTDGDGGLWAALARVYPHVPHQSCVFHKLQALAGHVEDPRNRVALQASAKRIYQGARAPQEARVRLRAWAEMWRATEPEAVRNFCVDFDKTLQYMELDSRLWRRARTNNPVERFMRELERTAAHVPAWESERHWERSAYLAWRRLLASGYAPTRTLFPFTQRS